MLEIAENAKEPLKKAFAMAVDEGIVGLLAEKLAHLANYGGALGPQYYKVTLSASVDLGEHSFNVKWQKLRPLYVESNPEHKEIWDDWMWGGLVFFKSDKTWSVHT